LHWRAKAKSKTKKLSVRKGKETKNESVCAKTNKQYMILAFPMIYQLCRFKYQNHILYIRKKQNLNVVKKLNPPFFSNISNPWIIFSCHWPLYISLQYYKNNLEKLTLKTKQKTKMNFSQQILSQWCLSDSSVLSM